MRRRLANLLLRLVCWLVPEFVDDMLLADTIIEMTEHIAKNHRDTISALVAAYYAKTNIPPEDVMIVVERGKGEWVCFLDPKPQDWEAEEELA